MKRFLVRESGSWKGITERFSVLYNGKWLKHMESTSPNAVSQQQQLPHAAAIQDLLPIKYQGKMFSSFSLDALVLLLPSR